LLDPGAWLGAVIPRSPELVADDVAGVLVSDDVAGLLVTGAALELDGDAAADRPGSTSATSTANPAVSAALPPITHRRVRLTRCNAASRLRWAAEPCSGPPIEFSVRLMVAKAISRQ
jgi:hypothetical protein